MVRVLKIEQQGNREVRRTMQFSDQMWEEIRKLKLGGVTWELLPTPKVEVPKILAPSTFIPPPPFVPEVVNYERTIPAREEIKPKEKVVKTPKKEKNETPTVQKKRATYPRGKGNAKK